MTKQAKKIREIALPELKLKVGELKANYAREIVKSKTGARNEKAVNLKNLRKEIARVLTIITEKEYATLNKNPVATKIAKKVVAEKKEIKTEKPKAKAEKKDSKK